jgi:hypothetical protein
MIVRVRLSALKEGRWYEYGTRFALGGLMTLIAGIVADTFGPESGGLFLAFPAILCASVTLVEAHERREKRAYGLKGYRRGTDAAGLETAGAASLGVASLFIGSVVWFLVAVTCWRLRRNVRRTR